ncbi:acyltransferase [Streptomyces sp. RKND-216]|uniref:acyltransferase n=1 Tax=Streptomyces sp. RKND-216 TaxID=2562581 RepID=UPI00109E1677|nr:acyltransferase [Streptomyces sp. RKND-216]THA23420.1 acyltransferase [Streptomyces sp. RKND-216]
MRPIGNLFSALASRAVHAAWRRAQHLGAVTAQRPGPYTFRAFGPHSRLAFPQGTVFGAPWMEIGDHCVIGQDVTLTAGMMPGLDLGDDTVLTLGDGVVVGRGSHLIADASVTLDDDVFCGPYVYITSTNHSYDDPGAPVGRQWPRTAPVHIGAGSWLGAGAVVLPGARLGRNVVVAAGSVVRGEVPDHAVVAGAPARVVRRWDAAHGWQPPLRTPPPEPLPDGITARELRALAASERSAAGTLE